jgi:hypothetical protein
VFSLSEEQKQYLKKGTNVLAAYANIWKRRGRTSNRMDLWIEGITHEGMAHIDEDLRRDLLPQGAGDHKREV